MPETVAVSRPLRRDVGRVSYLVGVPRAATATLARVSEVVGVETVIPPSTSGAGQIARQVWNLVLYCMKCSGK